MKEPSDYLDRVLGSILIQKFYIRLQSRTVVNPTHIFSTFLTAVSKVELVFYNAHLKVRGDILDIDITLRK